MARPVVSFAVLLTAWVQRDLKIKYAQTLLGGAWALAAPLSYSVAFVYVFRTVLDFDAGIPYPSFVLSGMVLWQLFATGLSNASNAMAASISVASKIRYPRIVAPVAGVCLSIVDFAVAILMIPMVVVFTGTPISIDVLSIIGVFVGVSLLALGLGCLVSALAVFFRDLRSVMPLILQIALLLSPVAYRADRLEGLLGLIARLNPMATYLQGFRHGLFGLEAPSPATWGTAGALTAVWLLVGVSYFSAVQGRFVDVS